MILVGAEALKNLKNAIQNNYPVNSPTSWIKFTIFTLQSECFLCQMQLLAYTLTLLLDLFYFYALGPDPSTYNNLLLSTYYT